MSSLNYDELRKHWESEQVSVLESVSLQDSFVVPETALSQCAPSRGIPYLLTPEFLASSRWKEMCSDPLPSHTVVETHFHASASQQAEGELPTLEYVAAIDISFIKTSDVRRGAATEAVSSSPSPAEDDSLSNPVEDNWGDLSPTAIASLAVLKFPSLTVVHQDYEIVNLSIPYIPTFLAFRELPALLPLFSRLPPPLASARSRMLTLVDGNGALHPRRCGAATHLGVALGSATVGVAKELMKLDGMSPPHARAWAKEWFGMPTRTVVRAMAEAAATGTLWPSSGVGVAEAEGAVVAGSAAAAEAAVLQGWHQIGFPLLAALPPTEPTHAPAQAAPTDAAGPSAPSEGKGAEERWLDEPCWAFPLVGVSGETWGGAILVGGPSAAPSPASTPASASASASSAPCSSLQDRARSKGGVSGGGARARPVYVSTGHLCSLATAVRVVAASGTCKVPEPLRAADLGSREVVRRWISAREKTADEVGKS